MLKTSDDKGVGISLAGNDTQITETKSFCVRKQAQKVISFPVIL
jgi:hypothetical protein